MTFYDVGGLLVRRQRRLRRGVSVEVWRGDGWVSYPDIDKVMRHGHRLNDTHALALLQEIHQRSAASVPFSEKDGRIALRAPSKST